MKDDFYAPVKKTHADPGWYRAKIERVRRVEGQYGDQFVFNFSLKDNDGENVEVRKYMPISATTGNILGSLAAAIGINVAECPGFDVSGWLGKKIMVQLQDKNAASGIMSNIIGFGPVDAVHD